MGAFILPLMVGNDAGGVSFWRLGTSPCPRRPPETQPAARRLHVTDLGRVPTRPWSGIVVAIREPQTTWRPFRSWLVPES